MQVVPADHLAADEAARDVASGSCAAASSAVPAARERPRPRLLVARREERDQVQRLEEPPHDLARAPTRPRGTRPPPPRAAPRARPRASGRSRPARSRPRSAASSSAARARAAARAATRRALAPPRGAPASRSSSLDLGAELRVAGLRLLRDPLEPPLDVVAVGDEQLEPQRLEVIVGDARPPSTRPARPAARRPAAGSRAARRRSPARRRRGSRPASPSARRHDARDLVQPRVRDRRHPDVLACRVAARVRVSALNSVVLPDPGRPTMPTSSATATRRSR